MTSPIAGLAGAAIGVSFLGIGLGITNNIVHDTNKRLNKKSKCKKKRRK